MMMFEDREWSCWQEKILSEAEHGSGNIGVIARAGAGKTTIIEEITKRLKPSLKVLVLAFNTEIAAELDKRVRKGCQVMTLNGLGHRAISRAFGSKKPTSQGLVKSILKREEFFPHPSQNAIRNDIAKIIGRYKNTLCNDVRKILASLGINPLDILDESERSIGTQEEQEEDAIRRIILIVRKVLEITKHEIEVSSEIDYDDQIWAPVAMKLPTDEWDIVLGDEVQDWNNAQIELVSKAVRPGGGRIILVGDPRQSIYTFRGADPHAFGRLVQKFQAQVLSLPVTYRCGKKIVDVARKIVPDIEAGPKNPEGDVTREKKLDVSRLSPGDFVISRKNAPLIHFCLQTISKGMPAKIAGKDLGRDLLAIVEDTRKKVPEMQVLTQIQSDMKKKIEFSKSLDDDSIQADLVDKLECIRTLFMVHGSVNAVIDALNFLCVDQKKSKGVVLFTTAHRAKGLECDRVFLLEWTFRSDREEEQNLLYVAQTRAKKSLVCIEAE